MYWSQHVFYIIFYFMTNLRLRVIIPWYLQTFLQALSNAQVI